MPSIDFNFNFNFNMTPFNAHRFVLLALLGMVYGPPVMADAEAQRQADVAQRGADVMPFSLAATQHIFTKTAVGGIQQVTARKPSDAGQIRLVRGHLKDLQAQFLSGDFAGPAHIHGEDMPGLAQLKAAPRGKLSIDFRELPAGAELTYRTDDPALAQALHQWFDAQLSDHGTDAMVGHAHHHDAPSKP
jgi:hypothetical protein